MFRPGDCEMVHGSAALLDAFGSDTTLISIQHLLVHIKNHIPSYFGTWPNDNDTCLMVDHDKVRKWTIKHFLCSNGREGMKTLQSKCNS